MRCNETQVLKGQFIQDRQEAASGRCEVTAPELHYREEGVEHFKLFDNLDSLLQIFASKKLQKFFKNILTKNPPNV